MKIDQSVWRLAPWLGFMVTIAATLLTPSGSGSEEPGPPRVRADRSGPGVEGSGKPTGVPGEAPVGEPSAKPAAKSAGAPDAAPEHEAITTSAAGALRTSPDSARSEGDGDSFLLVVGGRWDHDLILERLGAPPPVVDPSAAPYEPGPHDSGTLVAVAAASMGGRSGLRTLLRDLRDQVERGITFLEPGVDGRLSAPIAREQIERWLARLQEDRLSYLDLFRLAKWIRTYYASRIHLTPAAQMRLYLTLGGRPYRTVDRVPGNGKALWEFVRDSLGTGEYIVAGADGNADGRIDRWILLGKDRHGRTFAFLPWRVRPAGADATALVRPEDHPEFLAGLLRTLVLYDARDPDNPTQLISRRVYRSSAAKE